MAQDQNSVPKGLLPFNWEEAQKRPDAVVTRGGAKVTLSTANKEVRENQQLIGWVNGAVKSWCLDGRWVTENDSNDDLFLKPELQEVYENAYKHGSGGVYHDTLQDALDHGNSYKKAVVRHTWQGDILLEVQIVHRYNK